MLRSALQNPGMGKETFILQKQIQSKGLPSVVAKRGSKSLLLSNSVLDGIQISGLTTSAVVSLLIASTTLARLSGLGIRFRDRT